MTHTRTIPVPDADPRIPESFLAKDFAFLAGQDMGEWLRAHGGLTDWSDFAAGWNDLPEDTFMADGGRYRQRRHAAFSFSSAGEWRRKPAQPHYQSRDRNPLNGGIERWFGMLSDATEQSPTLAAVFSVCLSVLKKSRPEVPEWHVETHQFRILAGPGSEGQPTPEGMHRDGVDFVLVLLIRRQNVVSGTTSIADAKRKTLDAFTLTEPMDAALVDDRHVYHGVTPITPERPGQPAYRDVLVVTWKAS
ncbi:MAG: 2OG-Fe dioxygenase family protein [Planctomycetota bacterium]|nr:2OG-Fe dioxygenase family protein [Planctomycetota bacterium]